MSVFDWIVLVYMFSTNIVLRLIYQRLKDLERQVDRDHKLGIWNR